MKLARSTILILIGMVIAIAIFNYFTREGFNDQVVISGTGLAVGPITSRTNASATGRGIAAPVAAANNTASSRLSSAINLPSATITVQPTVRTTPLTQVGSLGIQPINTQQVTDMAGASAVSNIQKGVVSTDSAPGAAPGAASGAASGAAPRVTASISSGSMNSPVMGPSSCRDTSMDYCDDCDNSDCNDGCGKSC